MDQQRVKILQSMPIFGAIREDTLEFILAHANIIQVQADNYFFREGDAASSMFVLEKGKVEVSKLSTDIDIPFKHLYEGDCFGEMALLDCFPRSASVKAIEACTAIEIPSSTLMKLYQHDLEQFVIIQMNMGREISRRLRESDQHLFH